MLLPVFMLVNREQYHTDSNQHKVHLLNHLTNRKNATLLSPYKL